MRKRKEPHHSIYIYIYIKVAEDGSATCVRALKWYMANETDTYIMIKYVDRVTEQVMICLGVAKTRADHQGCGDTR